MAMKDPVHPGVIVREDCMEPLNLSVTECARVLNAKTSVSVEMAYRLSKAFGSTPRRWLGMQLAFDLAHSKELEEKIRVKRISAERGSRARAAPRSG